MPTKPLVDLTTGVAERHIYFSEEVCKQELANIFGRCWLYVAHESRIPKANDFLPAQHADGHRPGVQPHTKRGEPAPLLRLLVPDDGSVKGVKRQA